MVVLNVPANITPSSATKDVHKSDKSNFHMNSNSKSSIKSSTTLLTEAFKVLESLR
jgi:hypothetical protein